MAKTAPENISVINRRNYATELRVRGYTYRKIADELHRAAAAGEKEYNIWAGYDERDAWRDVRAELDNTIKETRETTEDFIALELSRLDLVTKAVYDILNDEDASPKIRLAAMDRLLKSQERRAKLLGLDMPTTVKTIDWRSEIIALIVSGQITIEQVRKELPEYADEITSGFFKPGRDYATEVREIETGKWSIPDEGMAEEPLTRH
jgi:predicted transcriptional regulator